MKGEDVDYTPCCPSLNMLGSRQRVGHTYQFPFGPSQEERVCYCTEQLGVDQVVHAAEVDTCFPAPGVSAKVWMEGGQIHKVWTTPAGELHAAIHYDDKWPYGLDIPLFHDFIGHYAEPWLKTGEDLECLKYILRPADRKEHLEQLRFQAMQSKQLAEKYQLATSTQIGSGLTGAQQMCGAEALFIKTMDDPEIIHGFLEIEHRRYMRNIEIADDLGIDVISRNGFYETADAYSPSMLEDFLGKHLREEIEAVHQAGKVISYTVNSGVMPMLDYLDALDFDTLFGIDIYFQNTDIRKINEKLGGKKSFWIGPPSQTHIYAEDDAKVRESVREVFDVFGKRGLILTACASAHSIMPWENTLAMIDEWKKLR